MAPHRFRYSPSVLRTTHMAALLSLVLVPMVGLLLVLSLHSDGHLDVATLIHTEDGSLDYEILILGGALVLLAIIAIANRQVRLELDSTELRVHIPRWTGLGMAGLTTGSHRILLASIADIRLTADTRQMNLAQGLQRSRLELVTDRQTYRFQPYNFLDSDAPDHRLGLTRGLAKSRDTLQSLLTEAPLVKALTELSSKPLKVSDTTSRSGPLANQFNLMTHKGMVISLILLATLGLYALADFLLLTEYRLIGPMPVWPFVSIGLLAGALGIRLGRGAPMAERLGVAVLLTCVALAATYPALQRLTLFGTPVTGDYEVQQPGVFTHSQLPTLDLRDTQIPEYWESLPTGSVQTFQIYEVEMGIRLVDLSAVFDKSRAFYREQKNSNEPASEAVMGTSVN